MSVAAPLRIRSRVRDGAILVHPAGVLDLETYAQLRDTLVKCAADEPDAVIVDVDKLSLPATYSLSVFTTVSIQLSEWPGVPLLLVATDPARRASLAISPASRFVPVLPDIDAAMRAVGDPPPRHRQQLSLPGDAASSGTARRFVQEICRRWGIATAGEDAEAIATELVENAVQHTASAPELRLELRRGLLSVAVADGDRRPAVLREAVNRTAPSAGLAIVAKLSSAWGCTPTADGKVVWAVLRIG